MQTSVVLFLLLSIAANLCIACSPPMVWSPEPFLERAKQAHIVFQGKVTNVLTPLFSFGLYEAVFDVSCVYESGGKELGKSVTVLDFGYDGGRCSSTDVEEGENYVVLARDFGDGILHVQDINIQRAAELATPGLIASVESEFECNKPTA